MLGRKQVEVVDVIALHKVNSLNIEAESNSIEDSNFAYYEYFDGGGFLLLTSNTVLVKNKCKYNVSALGILNITNIQT